jgi:hypothetical protein
MSATPFVGPRIYSDLDTRWGIEVLYLGEWEDAACHFAAPYHFDTRQEAREWCRDMHIDVRKALASFRGGSSR